MKQLPTPLSICLVSNTAWAIHTYRHGLIRRLISQGAQITVLAPRDQTFTLLERMGCRCVEIPIAAKSTRLSDDLHTLYALYRHYRAIKPHFVFHYTIKPNIYGSIAAKLARVPSIAVTTGLGYVFIRNSRAAVIAKQLYKFAFRFPREIWFLNRDDRAVFLDERLIAHAERTRLLPGEGVDLLHFPYTPLAPRAHFTFILIGRLLWDKGVGEYVEAARALRAAYPHARFQLLGPADAHNPSAVTQAEVDAWRHEGIIEYLGQTQDVRPYIAAADCVVLPSYREGVPRTLLEAAAMGRPIVATDVPGCREVVTDGLTGLLCEARSAASLEMALAKMLDISHDTRYAMGERGHAKVVREFDEAIVIDHYLNTLRDWIGASPS